MQPRPEGAGHAASPTIVSRRAAAAALSERSGPGRPVAEDRLTRRELIQRSAAVTAPAILGAWLVRVPTARATVPKTTLAVGPTELAQVRRNIFELKLPFARRAWAATAGRADGYLGYEPSPTRPDSDLSDWRESIYVPGLRDGNAALTLATAYAVGGRRAHGLRAKAICLAWARTYNPAPSLGRIGHMVAEPVGPVIKLCMAYDLAKPVFSNAERGQFRSWAAQFVERGRIDAELARDKPWVGDVAYGDDRANPAPYGNSATWQRAMAVWSAAIVGGSTLRRTLEWNLQHTTPGGLNYGWDDLVEGLVIDGSGGQVLEDRYRSSIEYGHFSWIPLVLIADLARRVRFHVDLFEYRTKRHGYTVFTPVAYYAHFLSEESIPDGLERTQYGGSAWPSTASRWRAAYEILYRNASDPPAVKTLRSVVNHGGPRRRGDNYDVYILGHAALFGRGPEGPRPPSR
jgi:Alginate lyase